MFVWVHVCEGSVLVHASEEKKFKLLFVVKDGVAFVLSSQSLFLNSRDFFPSVAASF